MGKGDKKSRRGKIVIGSYGVRRPKSSKNKNLVAAEAAPAAVVEKVKAEPKAKAKAAVVADAEPVAVVKKEVKKAVKKVKETEAEKE